MTLSLVTGATGYVGGRLVPELLEAGHDVRVLVRSPEKAEAHDWAPRVEIVQGDATSDDDVRAAMDGVDVLYYLLHSIGRVTTSPRPSAGSPSRSPTPPSRPA